MKTQLIDDSGFIAEDWPHGFTENPSEIAGENGAGLDIAADAGTASDLAALRGKFETLGLIRICFPSALNGRGFTLAQQLRLMGYTGRLRAFGPIIADQYAMARRAGFDEVEIPEELAARQPEDQWLFRAAWQEHDHQATLRAPAA